MSSIYQMVNSFPMLKDGEEKGLWAEYFDENTKKSRKKIIRDKIITSHLRLALKIAKKWTGSKLPLRDLFGEAQVGLVYAFDKFSTDGGATFATYSSNWIRAKVSEYVMQNASSMKNGTTAFQKFLFFNYGKIKKQMESENPDFNADQIEVMIAKKLIENGKSSTDDLEKTLKELKDFQIGRANIASLDAPLSDDGESSSYVDFVADPNARPAPDIIEEDEEKVIGHRFLVSARDEFIRVGKKREWEILKARRLDDPKKTLEDLSVVYDVSRERIRQIEVAAFERLQGMAKRDFQTKAILEQDGPAREVKRNAKKATVIIPSIPVRPKQTQTVDAKSIVLEKPKPDVEFSISGGEDDKQFTSSYLNQKLSMEELLKCVENEGKSIPLVKGRGDKRVVVGYFVDVSRLSQHNAPRTTLAFSGFKKKSSDYADSKSILILTGRGVNRDVAFIPVHLFTPSNNVANENANRTKDYNGIAPLVIPTAIEKVDSLVSAPNVEKESRVAETSKILPSNNAHKPNPKTNMVKILRSLDLSVEDYPYIPKSVGFDEMVAAVHQFSLGNTDYFERATKVIKGVEHPKSGRWVYVGPSVGQPKLEVLFSNVSNSMNAVDGSANQSPDISIDPVTPQKDPVEEVSTHGEVIKDTFDSAIENTDNMFSFSETRSIPYKPWTLLLSGEEYHLSNADKKFVEYLLNKGEPQSKEQLSNSGIAFHGPLQKKFTDMGLLKVYRKSNVSRITYYGISTEGYTPEYNEYYLRGSTKPSVKKTSSQKGDVKIIEKTGTASTSVPSEKELSIGALVIDPSKSAVSYEGQKLSHVVSKPYEALLFLAKSHGDFVTKEALSMHFFGNDDDKSIAQIDRGIKGLAGLIDRTIPSLSQSLIMKVGDKGYALTLSMEDRHAVYEKSNLPNPHEKKKVTFASPHAKPNGSAKTAMDTAGAVKKTVVHRQPQGGGRKSMAEQLAHLQLTGK